MTNGIATVNNPEKALAERIRQLRRRHFGPRGKDEFARQLGIRLDEYEGFERGKLPPGELMVRMCELTGEDLQWLLTGVAGRGTVVISGTRNRHQNLLTQIARALDAQPRLAAPLEAFLDLLLRSEPTQRESAPGLPALAPDDLIPVFGPGQWPDELPDPDDPGGCRALARISLEQPLTAIEQAHARLAEPAMEYDPAAFRSVRLLAAPDAAGRHRRFVQSREVARCFPAVFGVALDDEVMQPMFAPGDVLVTAAGAEPAVGRPALCKFADHADDRCRIWLGEDDQHVHLGRVSDGQEEQMPRAQLRWSREVLYRVAQAA